jgi:hypothetical protein
VGTGRSRGAMHTGSDAVAPSVASATHAHGAVATMPTACRPVGPVGAGLVGSGFTESAVKSGAKMGRLSAREASAPFLIGTRGVVPFVTCPITTTEPCHVLGEILVVARLGS